MATAYVLDDLDVAQLTEVSKLLESKNKLIAQQAAEIERLQKELLALRSGRGINVTIEGHTFPLAIDEQPSVFTMNEEWLQNKARDRNPLEDSFVLDKK